MASSKDFAKQARRKRKTPAKPAPKPASHSPSQPLPKKSLWKRIMAAFLLLTGLVFLINRLIQVNPATTQPYPQPRQVTPAIPKKPTPTQPVAHPKAAPKRVVTTQAKLNVPAKSQPQVVKQPAKAAPPKPKEEKFTFYELLPESEVTPPKDVYKSTPRTAKPNSTYLLQVGSFRNLADAETMRAQLLMSGFKHVKTSRSEGKNGIWHRVRLGPFKTRSALNKTQDKLVRLDISPITIKLD